MREIKINKYWIRYLLNTENSKKKNVIQSLQNIFYKLYKENKEINISEIFLSLEWEENYGNSPQDIEEIFIKIYEIICLNNTRIKNYYEGILQNIIRVDDINLEITKEENFFFLQLDIENNNFLDDCLLIIIILIIKLIILIIII